MNKLVKIISAVTVISLLSANIPFVNAEQDEPVMTGVYYNSEGKLTGVKRIKGNLSEDETERLLNIIKPYGSEKAKLYTYNSDSYEAGEMLELKDHDITILNTGDLRGYIVTTDTVIGMDKIAALKALTPNALLFDAGDATQGVSYAALTRGEDVMFTMNTAGYDGMVLGNHEFDYGFDALLTNVSLASFPVMAANVVFPEREDSRSITIPANKIYEVNGHKVGVFGVTTKDTKSQTNPDGLKGVDFKDEIETAKEQVEYLKKEGADIIIALAHIGTGKQTSVTSTDLAKAMEGSGLDVIIDGHGKNSAYLTESGISIVHAGSNGEYVGNLGIDVDDSGKITVTPVLLDKDFFDNIPSDEKTEMMIKSTLEEQNGLLDNVVAYSGTTLWGGKINGVSEGRVYETNLGDYICDQMIAKVKEDFGDSHKNTPIVAMENGGGMRASVPIGEVTWRDIINILPFSNTVKCKIVNPKIIYDMLEASVSSIEGQNSETGMLNVKTSGNFLQVGGMSFEYDPDAAAGSKVKAVYLDNSDKALDRKNTSMEILLVSNDYIIGGGDGFDMLTNLPDTGVCGGLAEMLTASLSKYNSESPLEYPVTDNRIRTTGSYKAKDYTANIYVTDEDDNLITDTELTYYVDGNAANGKTDEFGVLKVSVTDGPHGVSLDKKTEVYINNYSGVGVDETRDYPVLIFNK